jgi:hypothetical protein
VHQSPGEQVLTPQQASHLLATLARLSGTLRKIAADELSPFPTGPPNPLPTAPGRTAL